MAQPSGIDLERHDGDPVELLPYSSHLLLPDQVQHLHVLFETHPLVEHP